MNSISPSRAIQKSIIPSTPRIYSTNMFHSLEHWNNQSKLSKATAFVKNRADPAENLKSPETSRGSPSPVASERRDASRLKVVLRNGGCPGLSGGRSDSPHRGIPQQHIMRLWWNQSLASCGWWLVGDPSVPSVRPFVRPSVRTYVRTYVRPRNVLPRRAALLSQRRRSSSIVIKSASWQSSSLRVIIPSHRDEDSKASRSRRRHERVRHPDRSLDLGEISRRWGTRRKPICDRGILPPESPFFRGEDQCVLQYFNSGNWACAARRGERGGYTHTHTHTRANRVIRFSGGGEPKRHRAAANWRTRREIRCEFWESGEVRRVATSL